MLIKKSTKKYTAALLALIMAVSAHLAINRIARPSANEEPILRVYFYDSTGNYAPGGNEWSLWYWIDGIVSGRLATYQRDNDGNFITSDEFYKGENHARIFEVTLTEKAANALRGGKKLGMVFPQHVDNRPNWSTKDIGSDRFVVPYFNGNLAEVYVFRGDKTVYNSLYEAMLAFEQVQAAQFADVLAEKNGEYKGSFDTVRFTLTSELNPKANKVSLYKKDENGESVLVHEAFPKKIANDIYSGYVTFNALSNEFDFTAQYEIGVVGYNRRCSVDMTKLLATDEFGYHFNYDGDDLGVTYTPQKTTFKMWSPLAKRVQINFYTEGDQESSFLFAPAVDMERGDRGVWWHEYTQADLKGVYYTYTVHIYDDINEVVDLYARSAGVNGDRGMILDLNDTDPDGWENDKRMYLNEDYKENVNAPIIWEVHVRDFSIHPDSGMKYKGKFLAFTEQDTTLRGDDTIKTGINYLKDMGFTYVHILPMYDYSSVAEHNTSLQASETSFNWGYDPKNYNVPEGSYSTDPANGEVRIRELKQMIQALHNAGIGVIMDVVYNHTSASSGSFFDMSMPGYYYRQYYSPLVPYGTFADGSGCGNETASERYMMRKYMIDSLVYWAEEYNLDGFRFDLMSLHDRDTMNAIRAALNQLDNGEGSKILMYGEPWSVSDDALERAVAGTENGPSNRYNMYKIPGVGAFSDVIRKALRGDEHNYGASVSPGYTSGDVAKYTDAVRAAVQGKTHDGFTVNEPSQLINYISKHDNNSYYDHTIRSWYGNASPNTYIRRNEAAVRANVFAGTILMTSRGIPFMQAGEEFCRTKMGNHNSYNSPDHINLLDWGRMREFMDVTEYYKGLVELRKKFTPLQDVSDTAYGNFATILDRSDGVISYALYNYTDTHNTGWKYMLVFHNPYEYADIDITITSGNYIEENYLDASNLYLVADNGMIDSSASVKSSNHITLKGRATAIYVTK